MLINAQQQTIDTQIQLIASFKTPEEKEHKRSIVISNFPEPVFSREAANPKPSVYSMKDVENVKELFDEMDLQVGVAECYRMGSRAEGKTRLVKVRLQTSAQAKEIISNARKINETKYKNKKIILRKSMTPDERTKQDEKFQQMKVRIAQLKQSHPENDYRIYANRINIKTQDGRLRIIDDPLNGERSQRNQNHGSGSNSIPLAANRSFFRSNEDSPMC
uniref:Uncharacterized protein n=1 Tax=Panagrolaimus superbus TaxID=310955 RepID=A0A914XYI7_9BILA